MAVIEIPLHFQRSAGNPLLVTSAPIFLSKAAIPVQLRIMNYKTEVERVTQIKSAVANPIQDVM